MQVNYCDMMGEKKKKKELPVMKTQSQRTVRLVKDTQEEIKRATILYPLMINSRQRQTPPPSLHSPPTLMEVLPGLKVVVFLSFNCTFEISPTQPGSDGLIS